MSEFESVHIETRGVGEMAREEVSAAREAGIDPLDLAHTHTHDRVAAAIRNIVHWQNAADHRGRAGRAAQSRELRDQEQADSWKPLLQFLFSL